MIKKWRSSVITRDRRAQQQCLLLAMLMVGVNDSSLQAHSTPKSVGLVQRRRPLAAVLLSH